LKDKQERQDEKKRARDELKKKIML